jgi:hypothetical protein
MSADQTVTPQPRPTDESTKLDEYPRRDRRRFDNSGPDQLSQDEARKRRLNGFAFVLTTDFDLADEIEAVVRPVSGRVTHALTSRAYSEGTKARIEDFADGLVKTVDSGVARLAKPLALPVPAKLPTFNETYLRTSDNTLSSLLVAHAELVSPTLSLKVSRHSPAEIELARWSPTGAPNGAADRLLAVLVPLVREMVLDLDTGVLRLRRYFSKLDKLPAPLGERR